MAMTIYKGYIPGSIGRIVERHSRYYSKLVGFGLPFESKVARELSDSANITMANAIVSGLRYKMAILKGLLQ
jgi:hypothetical protein